MAGQPTDIVAIFQGDNLSPVLVTAQPLACMVYDVAELMEHPLETGSLIADHMVFKPVEIDMPMQIDETQVFTDLRQLYLDRALLTVQTRVGSYSDMVIIQVPHEETPAAFDVVTSAVRFRQAKFVTPQYGAIAKAQTPTKPAAASTVKRGAQQTTTAPPAANDRGSTLYRLSGLGKK